MYKKVNSTHGKVVRYLVSNEFILDSGNTLLPKSQSECYIKYPVVVNILDDGTIHIKDTQDNRRYVFDNQQSSLVITHFIKYLVTTPNIILF